MNVCVPQIPYLDALIPNVMAFGVGPSRVIRLRQGHGGRHL